MKKQCDHDLKAAPIDQDLFELVQSGTKYRKSLKLKKGDVYCVNCWMTDSEVMRETEERIKH